MMDLTNGNRIQSYNQQEQQPSSGLLRFRSAPSSLFEEGSESERLFSRFVHYNDSERLCLDDNKSAIVNVMSVSQQQRCSSSPSASASGLPPHYPRNSTLMGNGNIVSSFGLLASNSMAASNNKPVNSSSPPPPCLVRQSSSPAGLFSHLNGYAAVKGTSNYGGMDGSQGELSPSTNRLKSHISFSTRLPSSLGMLSQISEVGNESLDEEKLGSGNGDARFYGTGFPFGSWNDSVNFTDSFGGLRRDQENNRKLCSSTQNEDLGNRIHLLSHHLSLPKNSAEVAIEKFLHFQDSVPCKVRAKRGCATHPRSIAERVRRTRISERMRKLQELVPNMDKQTNTADMLDLAVEYIKDLQKQFKTLSDNRANCKCLSVQKPIQNQVM